MRWFEWVFIIGYTLAVVIAIAAPMIWRSALRRHELLEAKKAALESAIVALNEIQIVITRRVK